MGCWLAGWLACFTPSVLPSYLPSFFAVLFSCGLASTDFWVRNLKKKGRNVISASDSHLNNPFFLFLKLPPIKRMGLVWHFRFLIEHQLDS